MTKHASKLTMEIDLSNYVLWDQFKEFLLKVIEMNGLEVLDFSEINVKPN